MKHIPFILYTAFILFVVALIFAGCAHYPHVHTTRQGLEVFAVEDIAIDPPEGLRYYHIDDQIDFAVARFIEAYPGHSESAAYDTLAAEGSIAGSPWEMRLQYDRIAFLRKGRDGRYRTRYAAGLFRDSGEILIQLTEPERACTIVYTAIAHEIVHLLLRRLEGDADGDHFRDEVWGGDGFVRLARQDLRDQCIGSY